MTDVKDDFKCIVKNIMSVYQEEVDNFIRTHPEGSLTDADVIIMNMNVIMSISTNMYYYLKDLLPTIPIDFDYIKATIINHLKDNFEKVKEYNPKHRYMPLSVEQVKEIREKGSTVIKMPDGSEKTVTQNDILVKESDAEKVLNSAKNEVKNASYQPKIILPPRKH